MDPGPSIDMYPVDKGEAKSRGMSKSWLDYFFWRFRLMSDDILCLTIGAGYLLYVWPAG